MTLTDLKPYTNRFPAVPVTLTFSDAHFDALSLTQQLRRKGTPCFLLTGHPKETEDGYTFIGVHPDLTLTYRNGQLTTTDTAGHTTTSIEPLAPRVDSLLAQSKTPKISGLPPFTGGLVGYFGYDYARYVNPTLPQHPTDPMQLDDADLLMINSVIAYNQRTQMVTLSQIVPSTELVATYEAVMKRLTVLKDQILLTQPKPIQTPFTLQSPLKLQFDFDAFSKRVAATHDHIVAGDVFQLILSNPQRAQMSGSLFGVAPTLFANSPAPYQFYFAHGDFETIGASPETLITRRGDRLFTYPLAGTRRRGQTPAEDAALAEELTHSEKELAEHNMLIDLGRNDLGRVSQFGSVTVTKTRALLKFSNVMHMGSTVESVADPAVSPMDIVSALMPAGTLSGAPKVSAMQLISKLEGHKRGIYGGCLGYLDYSGELDLCIGIRLAYRKGQTVVVHSGAGIVADSNSKHEYQEFNNKARAVVDALTVANQNGGR